jgi:hypothetical protein
MLPMSIMLNQQYIVELVVALPAEVAGMFFISTQHKVVDSHDKRYTKCTLVQQDQHHFKSIPFTGFKQVDI